MSTRLPARRGAHTLVFALAIPPEQVVPRLLARDHVRERDGGAPLPADTSYDLERTVDGFTLTSDPGGPGAWRPGTRAICEGRLVPIAGGVELVVQFRLHPLTRGAFALLTVLGLAMVGFQLSVAGPTTAAVLLLPILALMAILAADRSGLRRQQESLRSLIESTFTPLAQPQLVAPDDPFRLPAPGRLPR
jgi:hypothetical protein